METRYTACGALEVHGTRDELRELAAAIEDLVRGRGGATRSWKVEATGLGGSAAGDLLLERGRDPVRVRVDPEGRSAALVGGERLLYIAAWLKALAARPGRRIELRWYPGHFYLAERTVPLAITSSRAPGSP